MSIIEIRDVTKTYVGASEEVTPLEELTFTIEQGDFVALMGPSGSGKSTLLNLLGGLDQPRAGTIQIEGVNLTTLPASTLADWRAAMVGFVFQFYNLIPVLSARSNVELPLLLTTLSKQKRIKHAQAALEIVGLADRGEHKPAELSGGQQQRVAIARAIVTDPSLLVCDEPTGDLDRDSADEILNLLQTLNRDYGKTIVMVTHDPKAAGYADRTLHMDKGSLIS